MNIEESGKKARALEDGLRAMDLEEGLRAMAESGATADEFVESVKKLRTESPVFHHVDMQQVEQAVADVLLNPDNYTVAVNVTMYYEFPKSMFPPWANGASVTSMVKEAFDDYNQRLRLNSFDVGGVLNAQPCEISIDKIMED